MTIKTNKLVLAALLGGIFMLNTQVVEAAPSYYKCDSGYSFKIKRDRKGARCERTTRVVVKAISCPRILGIGTYPHTLSGRDRCAARGPFKIGLSHDPLGCPRGYSYKKNHQGNTDKCVKAGKLTIKAPTKKFR